MDLLEFATDVSLEEQGQVQRHADRFDNILRLHCSQAKVTRGFTRIRD